MSSSQSSRRIGADGKRSLARLARRDYAEVGLFVLPGTVHARFPLNGCADPRVDLLRIDRVQRGELGHDVVKPIEALRDPASENRPLFLDVVRRVAVRVVISHSLLIVTPQLTTGKLPYRLLSFAHQQK